MCADYRRTENLLPPSVTCTFPGRSVPAACSGPIQKVKLGPGGGGANVFGSCAGIQFVAFLAASTRGPRYSLRISFSHALSRFFHLIVVTAARECLVPSFDIDCAFDYHFHLLPPRSTSSVMWRAHQLHPFSFSHDYRMKLGRPVTKADLFEFVLVPFLQESYISPCCRSPDTLQACSKIIDSWSGRSQSYRRNGKDLGRDVWRNVFPGWLQLSWGARLCVGGGV